MCVGMINRNNEPVVEIIGNIYDNSELLNGGE